MDKQLKRMLITVGFGVILFVGLSNLDHVIDFIYQTGKTIKPVIIAGILAFVLNVPLTKFSEFLEKIYSRFKKKPSDKAIQVQAFLLLLIVIAAIIALVCVILIPEIATSAKSAKEALEIHLPVWISKLNTLGINTDWLSYALNAIRNIDIAGILRTSVSGFTNTLIDTVTSTAGAVVNTVISIIIAFYLLMSRKTLTRQSKKLLKAYANDSVSDRAISICSLAKETYSNFFCGQCLEAIILGVLMFLAFVIFRLPYAGLVAVLTSVLSFIPYIGSFLACALGAVLTLMTSPIQALISIVVYQVVQFLENQFIYPRVVGRSVGLPALWTIIAVIVGGNLLGVLGMIFFIPFAAVIYKLLSSHINKKLLNKVTTKEKSTSD